MKEYTEARLKYGRRPKWIIMSKQNGLRAFNLTFQRVRLDTGELLVVSWGGIEISMTFGESICKVCQLHSIKFYQRHDWTLKT